MGQISDHGGPIPISVLGTPVVGGHGVDDITSIGCADLGRVSRAGRPVREGPTGGHLGRGHPVHFCMSPLVLLGLCSRFGGHWDVVPGGVLGRVQVQHKGQDVEAEDGSQEPFKDGCRAGHSVAVDVVRAVGVVGRLGTASSLQPTEQLLVEAKLILEFQFRGIAGDTVRAVGILELVVGLMVKQCCCTARAKSSSVMFPPRMLA